MNNRRKFQEMIELTFPSTLKAFFVLIARTSCYVVTNMGFLFETSLLTFFLLISVPLTLALCFRHTSPQIQPLKLLALNCLSITCLPSYTETSVMPSDNSKIHFIRNELMLHFSTLFFSYHHQSER